MPHPTTVSIAIPTVRRPEGLRRALHAARERLMASAGDFEVVEVIVVDNDPEGSARSLANSIEWPLLRYVHEANPGVAIARNRALDEAVGDILVMIDDDERPGSGWPDGLVLATLNHGAALVAGPVRSVYASEPPPWVEATGVFERPEPVDGTKLYWARSGNVAIDLRKTRSAGIRFDESFNSGGEDVRFSTLIRRAGLDMRWTSRPIVFEDVGIDRMTEAWVTERSRAAMYNYVRALAPLGPIDALRTGVVALFRVATGTVHEIAGRILRSDVHRLRGRLRRTRGCGALGALTQSVVRRHS